MSQEFIPPHTIEYRHIIAAVPGDTLQQKYDWIEAKKKTDVNFRLETFPQVVTLESDLGIECSVTTHSVDMVMLNISNEVQ